MSNYPLRLPEGLMDSARELAKAEGVSLNQFLATLIAERIGELKALSHVRERIARANRTKALAILEKIPSRRPQKGDELPASPAPRRKR